jgi:hypothetical protein
MPVPDLIYAAGTSFNDDASAFRGPGSLICARREGVKTLMNGGVVYLRGGVMSQGLARQLEALAKNPAELKEGMKNGLPGLLLAPEEKVMVFGDYDFAAVVGLWLEWGTQPAAFLLSPFIATEGFVFHPTEFVELRGRLRTALRRYERLPATSAGLEDLNTGFFRHRDVEESREFITANLATYLSRGNELHRAYLQAINRHDRAAAFVRRAELRRRADRVATLHAQLMETMPLASRKDRKRFRQLTDHWAAYCADFPEVAGPEPDTNAALAAQLQQETEQLRQRRAGLQRELKSASLALSPLTVNPAHGSPTELKALAERLADLVREINEAGLYQLPLGGGDAATAPRQLIRLEQLLAKLRNTHQHLDEWPVFYERRQFWYAQPAHLRRLLAPLLDLPPADWETAFSAWYYERCLENAEATERPATELTAATVITKNSPGRIVLLAPDAPWPANASNTDLLISDAPADDLPKAGKALTLRLARLHDPTARHLAVAGWRNPVLTFTQSFSPLQPPAWRERLVNDPPPGLAGRLGFQLGEGSDWRTADHLIGETGAQLNVYFPDLLTAEDRASLVDNWEQLITAAPAITYFHSRTPNGITQGLLSDGFNADFLCSALLRAAEAAATEPFDRLALVAIGREIRLRCGLNEAGPHPLAQHFTSHLRPRLKDHFFEIHVPWRDTFLPLVVLSPVGKKTVVLPGGRLPGCADPATEALRQEELKAAGFTLWSLNAAAVWEDWSREVAHFSKLLE